MMSPAGSVVVLLLYDTRTPVATGANIEKLYQNVHCSSVKRFSPSCYKFAREHVTDADYKIARIFTVVHRKRIRFKYLALSFFNFGILLARGHGTHCIEHCVSPEFDMPDSICYRYSSKELLSRGGNFLIWRVSGFKLILRDPFQYRMTSESRVLRSRIMLTKLLH